MGFRLASTVVRIFADRLGWFYRRLGSNLVPFMIILPMAIQMPRGHWSLRRLRQLMQTSLFVSFHKAMIQFWQMEEKPYPKGNVSSCLLLVSLSRYLKS